MSTLKYFTLDIVLPEEKMELLELIEHDGLEEYAIDEALVDKLLGEKAFSGGDVDEQTIAVLEAQLGSGKYRLYFHGNNANDRANKALNFFNDSMVNASLEQHDEQDWNEKWRQGYTTVKISPKLWVIPSWEKGQTVVDSGVTPLYLYPGQGFGTGRHETTSLCLELFENGNYQNQEVLDFGCGSGILGIAATLRFDCKVDYLDIDQSALENTVQNLEENNLKFEANQLILRRDFKLAERKYDLVFANILLDILISEKEAIVSSLKPTSKLIVSGLLNEHVEAFKNAYEDFKVNAHVSKGDWSALELVLK